MVAVLLIVALILIVAGAPYWGMHSFGYMPSGLGLFLVIVLIIYLLAYW
jgi:hypothetical protein